MLFINLFESVSCCTSCFICPLFIFSPDIPCRRDKQMRVIRTSDCTRTYGCVFESWRLQLLNTTRRRFLHVRSQCLQLTHRLQAPLASRCAHLQIQDFMRRGNTSQALTCRSFSWFFATPLLSSFSASASSTINASNCPRLVHNESSTNGTLTTISNVFVVGSNCEELPSNC